MRHRLYATAYYAVMGAAALAIGLFANVYYAKGAEAGWRGCHVGALGSWNDAVVEDFLGASGPGIAAVAGCDITANALVFGAEVEYGAQRFDWAGFDVDTQGWAASGRAGILVTPATLIYARAGWTQLEAEIGSASIDVDGALVGGGVEIDLTRGWFGRMEYQHAMLSTDDYDVDATVDSVKVGFIYRFSPEDPFAANKPLK